MNNFFYCLALRGLFFAFILMGVELVEGQQVDVKERTLSNGMKLLMLERHHSPTIAGGMAYFPIFTPPKGGDKCKNGAASICAVDDECGTNYSSTLGKHAKSDECLYVGEGILSKIVTFGGKLYANIAGKADDGTDLISKDAIGMEVDITRGTWKESF